MKRTVFTRDPEDSLHSQLMWLEQRAPRAAELLRTSPARSALVWTRHVGWDSDDKVLGAFPRSGSTWMRGMLADLLTGQHHDRETLDRILPYAGFHRRAPGLLPDGSRLIKTHEPYRREYKRAIYLVRDVCDVALSYFVVDRAQGRLRPTFPDFIDAIVRGRVDGVGAWQAHVASWLDARDRGEDILVVRYEDTLKDTCAMISRIADFLGVHPTDEDVDRVVANGQPKNVKMRKALEPHLLGRIFTEKPQLDEQSPEVQEALRRLIDASPARARVGYAERATGACPDARNTSSSAAE